MKKLLKNIKYLFKPKFWRMEYPYSRQWDDKLNEMLDKENNVRVINEFRADVGGIKVWIGNYPYAYGNPELVDIRPSRATIERLHKAVIKSVLEEGLKNN